MAESGNMAKTLEIGAEENIVVDSKKLLNRSYVIVEQGAVYSFTIDASQKWQDGGIMCGPNGWDRGSVELGLKEVPIAMAEPFRRNPDANWFEVVGVVGSGNGEKVRPLYVGNSWTPQRTGELLLFANDLESLYGNNQGSITVTITRLS